jgi:hypothetical protein
MKSNRELVSCLNCEKDFESLKSRKRKYCGHSCRASHTNPQRNKNIRPCRFCGSLFAGRNSAHVYCSRRCNFEDKDKARDRQVIEGAASDHVVKKYLYKKYGHSCWECELTEWRGVPIPLDMDHKDGNYENNTLDNVRLLCKNCHALTPTYGTRNKGNGRHVRRERRRAGKSG